MPDQKEILEVEDPAVEILTQHLGWKEIETMKANEMRDSLKHPILTSIFFKSIKKINPWISEENAQRVLRSVLSPQASSVLEANEMIHSMLERGTTVKQDLKDGLGLKSRDVFLIDYNNIDNNQFHVVRQFQIKHYLDCFLDIVLFVNGLPIVVMECKSPYIRDPMKKGIERLFRYQEMDDRFKNMGCPQLFNTAQIVVSTFRDKLKYGTNFTPMRHWSEWKDPYPLTKIDVAKEAELHSRPGSGQGSGDLPLRRLLQGKFAGPCSQLRGLREGKGRGRQRSWPSIRSFGL